MFLVFIGIASCFLMSVYSIDGHMIVYNSLSHKKNQFCRLLKLVSGNNKNILVVVWMAICLISEAMYISFIQRLNRSVKKIDNNTYEISYVVSGKLYKMRVKPKRGPAPVMQISNEKQEDITDQIIPYMGPVYNWHGNTFSPNCFGHETLIFEFADGSEVAFQEKSSVSLD